MNISITGYGNSAYGFNANITYRQQPPGVPADTGITPKVNTAQKPAPSEITRAEQRDAGSYQNQNKESDPAAEQPANTTDVNGYQLTQAEMQLLKELQQTDTEVRRHEMAHIAAGGRYITSGANFTYKRGPDGKNYAVGGEVGIDTSPVPGDPEATLRKMRQVKSSALAPANPSSQDLKVAAKAGSIASKALSELMVLTARQQAQANESSAFGNIKNAAETYTRVNTLPENSTGTFDIAV